MNNQNEEPLDRQSHYNLRGGIEAIDFGAKWKVTFCQGNALKYLYRHPFKGTGAKDIGKAMVYTKWISEKEKISACPDIPIEAIDEYIVSNRFSWREGMAVRSILVGAITSALYHMNLLKGEIYGS